MAFVKKTGIFYELLIRGHFGGAHQDKAQKQLGEFEAAHYIEAEAIVDDATGEVIQFKPLPAQELPREKVVEYLGERFVAFEQQQRALTAERDALVKERDALAGKLAQVSQHLSDAAAAVSGR